MCPQERFSLYKSLSRLVLCYKKDWATLLHLVYLLLLLVSRYNLSYHKTICYHLFQYLHRIPCWKPLIISFCSSLGSTLLLIERTMIDPLYLWVIMQQGGPILFVAKDKPRQFLIMRKALPRTHGNYRQASFLTLIWFAFGTLIIWYVGGPVLGYCPYLDKKPTYD